VPNLTLSLGANPHPVPLPQQAVEILCDALTSGARQSIDMYAR
jgi:hypothetical protein